ncbi:MAG: SURF1 family protein [Anaerolineales bacterium]|nr:SURF1 family protein [Anaerolineales bacterium]MDW8446310.1 SURF1 family protein [Anaerolineales bacterium]
MVATQPESTPSMPIREGVSRLRFWVTTLLVLIAVGVMVRLGIWQLDRLAQRRAFNARVQAQLEQPVLVLDAAALEENLDELYEMEYRAVIVEGVYDFAHQVALRNQAYQNLWGVYLLTPLKVQGSDWAIMVNRGWIPGEDFLSGDWSRYDQPGQVTVRGMIRRAQIKPDFGRRADPTPGPGQPPLRAWNLANIEAIARQIPYPVVPNVYVHQTEGERGMQNLPIPTPIELDLSEGPHLGYAIQWFTFATILGVGYPLLLRRRRRK